MEGVVKMNKQDELRMQEDAFQFIEEIKELLSPEIWNNILLNCSKNEILIFWLLYRKTEANMTEIAEYIHVPLNTATGIVGKMEKNDYIIRERLKEDKRVVVIRLTEKGNIQVKALTNGVLGCVKVTEEMEIFVKMSKRVVEVLKQGHKKEEKKSAIRRITIE